MAAFNFGNASLKISFETGIDEFGKSIIVSKTYRNVRDNVGATQVSAVVQAISSLTDNALSSAEKIEMETVEL
jgi:hypothetical protein